MILQIVCILKKAISNGKCFELSFFFRKIAIQHVFVNSSMENQG